MTFASQWVGQAAKLSLNPIPVSGPFDLTDVDVIKFPKSHKGNQNTVVFMDYLTKWLEVWLEVFLHLTRPFSLLDYLLSWLSVAMGLRLDRRTAFLSKMMCEVVRHA